MKILNIIILTIFFLNKAQVYALDVEIIASRAAINQDYPLVLYLKIENNNNKTDVLRIINSQCYQNSGLYKTIITQGTASIIPINSLAIPAFSKVDFFQNHIFITFKNIHKTCLKKPSIEINLTFDIAGKITIKHKAK